MSASIAERQRQQYEGSGALRADLAYGKGLARNGTLNQLPVTRCCSSDRNLGDAARPRCGKATKRQQHAGESSWPHGCRR